jgi:hypothetical protein
MHKVAKSAVATLAGLALALGVPLAASAAPVAQTVSVSHVASHNSGGGNDKGGSHNNNGNHGVGSIHKPHPTHPSHPAYPPTKPPKPPKPHFPHPFWWGGYWWFPFSFAAHTFHPGAHVHVHITGFGGFSFFGTFKATESGSIDLGTAAADGSLSAQLKAAGAKTLAGQTLNATVTDNAGTSVTQTITVPADAAKTAASSSSIKAADPGSLASTGSYISLATVWGAVGLLALGAGFVTMRSVVRRKDRAKA